MKGRFLVFTLGGLLVGACADGKQLPALDEIRQPSGLLISPDGEWLFVSNGNWTLDLAGATVVALDLVALTEGMEDPGDVGAELDRRQPCRRIDPEEQTVECEPTALIHPQHSVIIHSAAGNIAMDLPRGPEGPWRLLVPTRSPASIAWMDVRSEDDVLTVDCGQDESSRCNEAHAITAHAADETRVLPADPSRVFVDQLGFRYAYVPHLLGGNLSLLALDGESGPELTDVAEDFYRDDPFDDSELAGGFAVAQRACTPGAAPAPTEDCSRPLLYTTHRFWPGVRQFVVAPGLDVVVGHGSRALVDLNPNVVDQRPFMGDLAFEDPQQGQDLLVVHTTPAGLSRVDTRLDPRGNPYVNVRSTVELCDNPNVLRVHRPPGEEALALVSCFSDRSVAVVGLGSFRLAALIPVGEGPNEMVVDPARRRLYVANSREDTVSVVDLDRTNPTFLSEIGRVGVGAER